MYLQPPPQIQLANATPVINYLHSDISNPDESGTRSPTSALISQTFHVTEPYLSVLQETHHSHSYTRSAIQTIALQLTIN